MTDKNENEDNYGDRIWLGNIDFSRFLERACRRPRGVIDLRGVKPPKRQRPTTKVVGLSLRRNRMSRKKYPRNNRRIDWRPRSDVDRCSVVSVASVAALHTNESISARSIPIVRQMALRAFVGGPSRVNQVDRYSRESGLVLDECS